MELFEFLEYALCGIAAATLCYLVFLAVTAFLSRPREALRPNAQVALDRLVRETGPDRDGSVLAHEIGTPPPSPTREAIIAQSARLNAINHRQIAEQQGYRNGPLNPPRAIPEPPRPTSQGSSTVTMPRSWSVQAPRTSAEIVNHDFTDRSDRSSDSGCRPADPGPSDSGSSGSSDGGPCGGSSTD